MKTSFLLHARFWMVIPCVLHRVPAREYDLSPFLHIRIQICSRTFGYSLRTRPMRVNHHGNATERIAEHKRRDIRSQLRVEERPRVVLVPALALDEGHDRIP